MNKQDIIIDLNQSINSNSEEFKSLSFELQGNILSPHARDNAAHIFIEFKNPQSARKFIKDYLVGRITSSAKQKTDSDAFKTGESNGLRTFINFSFSMNGYRFLDIDEHKTPTDSSFRNGMKSKQRNLNDPLIDFWQGEYQKDWHAVMIVSNKSSKILRNRVSTIKKELNKVIKSIYVEIGKGIRNNEGNHIEHFGYVDGISQPHMLTDKIDDGKISIVNWNPKGRLNLALVEDPGGQGPNSFGSYLIFRKLDQNVKAFRLAEQKLAEKMQISVDYAGAQMVGRYRNGTPLIPISPPQPTSAGKMNDFNYSSDRTTGSKCPFGSHIRKTNQRNSIIPDGVQFPRRGITYGGNLSKNAESGVGLLFMAYNSNIGSQFELMQSSWANSTGFPGGVNSPNGIDSIIGQGNDTGGQVYFKEWGNDSSVLREDKSLGGFVTMKGGEYFFTPSLSFLKNI
ncbi:Dyp-type peroxidase [Maribacter sp.]|uniref:Dyp-type peroxidase n=1 Tax=Maribacter sp. TaxID=1897614 RepID=UPI0025C015AC|nr:Dyp-type peroxidase domain-containing protein [Maribacter sp.]